MNLGRPLHGGPGRNTPADGDTQGWECHSGWALYDRGNDEFTYGVIEPPADMKSPVARIDFALTEVLALLPGSESTWPATVRVFIEGFAFAANGNRALQLAGVGYMIRHALWKRGVPYLEITPNQGKKFLTGKHNCDKNLVLKEVYKRYRTPAGEPIDVEDDNIADAINMAMIGRTLLGWQAPANAVQVAIIGDLQKGPKPKVKKSRKKTAIAA